MTAPLSDSKGAAIKEQILKIVNDNRCDDHRCSKVADLNENAAQTILALLAQEVKRARIDELTLLIKDAAPLIPKESWEDWSWRVQKYLKDRLERLG